ncbi:hypothetical protein SAMCCGM7_pC2048 (plasmid) [Sinorhizobium americanum CCGM7]|nr:hypothetical protein SAMCCGM7_pC2048 [Sinorhizobium americanum CCGM7]
MAVERVKEYEDGPHLVSAVPHSELPNAQPVAQSRCSKGFAASKSFVEPRPIRTCDAPLAVAVPATRWQPNPIRTRPLAPPYSRRNELDRN